MSNIGHAGGSLPGITGLVLVRHGESEGNVAATLAHQAGARTSSTSRPATPTSDSRTPAGNRRWRWAGCWPAFPEKAAPPCGPPPTPAPGRPRNSHVQTGGWRVQVRLDERLRDRELGHPGHADLRGCGGAAAGGSPAPPVAGEVLLPPAGRRILGRRRAAAPLAAGRPGSRPRRRRACCWSATMPLIVLFRYILQGLDGDASCWTLPPRSSILNASVSRFRPPGRDGAVAAGELQHGGPSAEQGVPVTEHAGDADVHPR